jgi:hypothetical protein
MWVWQSQAPAGTSKLTGVDGCAALANALLAFMATPAATEASRIPRRVSMASSLYFGRYSIGGWHGREGQGTRAKARPGLVTPNSQRLVHGDDAPRHSAIDGTLKRQPAPASAPADAHNLI